MLSCVQLPVDPEFYSADVRPIVSQTIARFGMEEWRAGVLTHELHGHLGIYSIIGVKMGLAAIRYLNVEPGEVYINSFAGRTPPVSCLNDGLQVSTGATFGHGLIRSNWTSLPLPRADFEVGDRMIHIRLKPDVESMIKEEIRQAYEKYAHTPPYWEYVRKLAIKYWAELDKQTIFSIEEVPSGKSNK